MDESSVFSPESPTLHNNMPGASFATRSQPRFRMSFRFAPLALLLLASPAFAQLPDAAAVRAALDAFREAVVERDGEAAYALVDEATRTYYERLVEQARYTPEAALRRRAFPDQLAILSARLHVPHERLRTMTGHELFVYAVGQGWVGRELLRGDVGPVQIQDDVAGVLLDPGEDRYRIPVTFRREQGAWRLDLLAVIDATAEPLLAAIAQMGVSPSDLAMRLLAGEDNEPVAPAVWTPPFQRAP